MTDNEIIKALECCTEGTSEACRKCVLALVPYPVCKTMVASHALALINRQKEEIDVWRSAYDVAYSTNTELYEALKTARAETAKEFAEGLKGEMLSKYCVYFDYEITNAIIDNRVKEFTGETK